MKSIVRWLAYSPTNVRRGLMGAASLFMVVMVGLSVADASRGDDPTATRTPTPTPTTSSFTIAGVPSTPQPSPSSAPWAKPTPTATKTGERDEAATNPAATQKAAEKAARGFVQAWLTGPSTAKDAWLAKVLPFTDESSMRAALEATDPKVIPKAKIGATTNVDAGAFLAGVDVKLSDGQAVHLDVMLEDGRWVVYNYGPARG